MVKRTTTLNHVVTLRYDMLLIIIHVFWLFLFSDINVSQGTARNVLLSLPVEEF